MKRNYLILLVFQIVPFIALSQDSLVTVKISELRKASELIIEGDRCKAILPLKDAQIENKEAVITELKAIRMSQDSIIDLRVQQIGLSDSVILNKDQIIEGKNRQIRKQKTISIGAILTALLIVLVL